MAYRYDRKTDEIIIGSDDKGNSWSSGIAADPYSGTNRMYAVNLETQGEVSVGYPITSNVTSGATLGKPIADSTRFFSYNTPQAPTGQPQSFAILDDAGHIFESTTYSGTYVFLSSNNSTTNSSNLDGVTYWMGKLWKFRADSIDYWNGSTWVVGWNPTTGGSGFTGSLTATYKHYAYNAINNTVYIGNGNYLSALGTSNPLLFDPTNNTTYTYSATKLQLPVTDTVISICEVGGGNSPTSTLLIGGQQNVIYPWDKVSSSFAQPIYIGDYYIQNMVSANQNAFVFAGNQNGRGRIYITNATQASLFFKMPDYLFNIQDPYYAWGDAIFSRNNLIFGCFVQSNAGAVQNVTQVFAITLDLTKNIYVAGAFRSISEIPSPVTNQGNATCLISLVNITSPGFGYIVAWNDNGTAPGIGYSATTAGINSTGASIITDLIPIGTFLKKKTYSQVEYKLRSPLQSGESITVTPIMDGVSKTALTFSPTPATGEISGYASITFENAQWLQFQIALVGNSATSGVRLKEIRLIP